MRFRVEITTLKLVNACFVADTGDEVVAARRQLCGGSQAAMERMLAFGRKLQNEHGTSETNRKALHDAFSLLAYGDPWSSPVGHQLDPVQREPVCAALNSAILGNEI